MEKEKFVKRSERRSLNKRSNRRYKKKLNKRFIPLIVIFALFISVFAYAKSSSADNKKQGSNVSVELNVEKVDRDTVKLELDNFNPVIKSLQVSVKIDGNANFEEESINWLANSDAGDVKTHVKVGSDKKSMDIFIVSTEALNKIGGKLEICEIDVTKAGSGSSAYSIDANLNSDGVSYSYVINDTNKAVSGYDMANLSEEKLTINSVPVINLKSLPSIVDGKIVVSKGDTFDAKTYIEVTDEEDGLISVDKVTVTGKVNTKIVGSYNIEYSVADSDGDSVTLGQTVIVEEVVEENVSKPEITVDNNGGNDNEIVITAGDDVKLTDFITAVDYLGRPIDVVIDGEYDLAKAGTYKLTLKATDRLGNVTEKEITLIVEKKVITAPVINNAPEIVANDVEIKIGDIFEVLENVTASDKEDGDLTSKIEVVENNVDTTKAGKYKVTYSVADSNGAKTTKTINVTVNIKLVELEPSKPIDPDNGNDGDTDNGGDTGNGGNDGDNGEGDTGNGDNETDKPTDPVDPESPTDPEKPGDTENPGDTGSDEGSDDSTDKDETETPNVPVNPENPSESDNNTTNNGDTSKDENKNDLPKTGQGIFYGAIIALAVVIIGAGIFILTKKKK